MLVNIKPRIGKPPFGSVQVDWGHPLSQGLLDLWLLNEQARPREGIRSLLMVVGGGTPSPGNNVAGTCQVYGATSAYDILGSETSVLLPTTSCTIALIRRKQDTTARAAVTFALDTGTAGERCNSHTPFSDGIVYFDFGGLASPNRISYTWSATTNPERFVFVAGRNGSAIYLNGVSQVSQTTAITRASTTQNFLFNQWPNGAVTGDLQELNFFGIWSREWTAAQVAWWSVEPYAFLTPIPSIRYWAKPPAGAAAAASVVTPRLLALTGVGA